VRGGFCGAEGVGCVAGGVEGRGVGVPRGGVVDGVDVDFGVGLACEREWKEKEVGKRSEERSWK
jgi:hypothetical protein